MAFAETANLAVKLSLGGNFNSQLAKTRAGLRGFDKDASRAYKAGAQIGTGLKRSAYIAAGGIALLASQVALGLDSLVKLESQTAQTNAVIKSTKGVAGITAQAVGTLAEKYESLNATIGDEVIRSTENMLLTFTNVRTKAFEPALAAILDMNQAMGGGEAGLQATAIRVGKALNDPIKGITALSRVGVKFTSQQIKQIKALVKQGDILGAQRVILKELNTEFGGSFLAGGNTTAGKVAKFNDSIEDLRRSLAQALLPTIGKVADKLSAFLADPKVIAEVGKLGDAIGDIFSEKNIEEGAKVLGDVFEAAKTAAPIVAAAARAMASVVSTAVKAFTSLPDWVQQVAIGAFAVNKLTGGLITNIAGGIFGALKVMTVQAAVVNVNGGLGGGGGVPGAAGGSGLAGLIAPIASVAAVAGVAAWQQNEINNQGNGLLAQTRGFAKNATDAELARSIDGVSKELSKLGTNEFGQKTIITDVLNTLIKEQNLRSRNANGGNIQARTSDGRIAAIVARAIAKTGKTPTQEAILATLRRNVTRQQEAIRIAREAKAKAQATAAAVKDADSSIDSGANKTAAAARDAGYRTSTALKRLPAPTVNVKVNVTPSQIQKSTTIQYRYGPANGSAGGNTSGGGSRPS